MSELSKYSAPLYGYTSVRYRMLEDLAEVADYPHACGTTSERAIADYVKALHSVAQMRTEEATQLRRIDKARKAKQAEAEQRHAA